VTISVVPVINDMTQIFMFRVLQFSTLKFLYLNFLHYISIRRYCYFCQ